MNRLLLCLCAFSLFGCVSPSLNDTSEFEQYPLRAASDTEAKQLEDCLRSVLHAENALVESGGKYSSRISDLKVVDFCPDIHLHVRKKADGFNAIAQFHKDDQTVRWTMDEHGRVTEDAEPEMNEEMVF